MISNFDLKTLPGCKLCTCMSFHVPPTLKHRIPDLPFTRRVSLFLHLSVKVKLELLKRDVNFYQVLGVLDPIFSGGPASGVSPFHYLMFIFYLTQGRPVSNQGSRVCRSTPWKVLSILERPRVKEINVLFFKFVLLKFPGKMRILRFYGKTLKLTYGK